MNTKTAEQNEHVEAAVNKMVERLTLWKDWSEAFLKAKTVPMSDENSRVFMACIMAESDPTFPGEEFEKSFQFQVISKRAEFSGLIATKAVLTFITAISTSPGNLVMYNYALRYAQVKKGIEVFTVSDLVDLFPNGFIPAGEMSTLWDLQKGGAEDDYDNLLDVIQTTDAKKS